MKALLPIFLVVSLIPPFSISTATAQDSDLLGVFFDESGDLASFETTEPYQVVPFHIILLEPSHEEGIHAWECVLEGRTGEEPALMVNWVMAGGAFNAAQFPALLAILNTPLPPAASVVLASGAVLVPDPETEILFYLHPYDFPSLENPPEGGYPVTTPLYSYGEDLYQPLGWTSGCEAEPLARINDDGEDPSWSLGDLPEELLFGYVPAGETATRVFHLQNTGEVALSGQLSISGDGFQYCYLYNAAYPYGLWTSDTQWFRMEPQWGSYIEIRLESATDLGYEGALDLTLCGEATTIVLVKQMAFYSCNIDPPAIDFGEVDLYGQGSWTSSVTVTNNGTLPLELVVDEDCPDFVVESSCGLIPPGDSCNLGVTFEPSELGPQECVVSINEGLCELVCTAVVIEGPPQCIVAPPGWDFGLVWAGQPAQKTWEVLNAGGLQLEGQVTIPESCSGFTVVEGAEPFSLAHEETHQFTVAFDPVEGGLQECTVSVSADCIDLELVGRGLVLDGDCWDYEYASGPLLGEEETPGAAQGVVVSESFAYVADGESGLQVIDITDIENPVMAASMETPGYARDLAVSSNYVYVADSDSGLQIADVSDPWSPRIVSSIELGSAWAVTVSGDWAYVVGENEFFVIDISKPEYPQITDGVELINIGASARDVVVSNNHAFVVGKIWAATSNLWVIGILDPSELQIETSMTLGPAHTVATGVVVSDNYAYICNNFFDSVEASGFMMVVEISDPQTPLPTGAMSLPDHAERLAISGNYAYIGDRDAGLQVIDISVPEFPEIVGAAETPDHACDVAIAGNYAYVADWDSGLQIALRQCEYVGGIESDPDADLPSAGLDLAVHPNPFNPRTTISFAIDHPQIVELCVFDMSGKRITVLADRALEAGQHSLDWEGRDLQGNSVASGTYLVRMVSDEGVTVEKMMLIR